MSLPYFIAKTPIEPFTAEMEAAGCLCIYNNKILLLKRHSHKPYGDTWGIPGGKMEKGESVKECAIREVFEESGLHIDDETLISIGPIYCRIKQDNKPFSYIFHLFQKKFESLPDLTIGLNEHVDGNWFTIDEAFQLPLIVGGKEVLECFASSIA